MKKFLGVLVLSWVLQANAWANECFRNIRPDNPNSGKVLRVCLLESQDENGVLVVDQVRVTAPNREGSAITFVYSVVERTPVNPGIGSSFRAEQFYAISGHGDHLSGTFHFGYLPHTQNVSVRAMEFAHDGAMYEADQY